MSSKRRRSIAFDLSIIRILKDEAGKLVQKMTHTGLLSKILLGQAPPLASAIISPDNFGVSKGVSMKESVWLSVKVRAGDRGESIAATGLAILLGKASHLTPKEIELGEKLARERENLREPTTAKARAPKKETAKKDPKKTKTDTIKKPKGTSHLKLVYDEKAEEERDRMKRQSRLSGGVPIKDSDIAPDSAFKDLNSSKEEYFGGVFSL